MSSLTKEDNLIVEALKLNWEHARHIEAQRLRLFTAYILIMFGVGLTLLKGDLEFLRYISPILGISITLFCWIMTRKWNKEFVNQIKKADICAKKLNICSDDNSDSNLHNYIGFPIKRVGLDKLLNVRHSFTLIYLLFFIIWIFIFTKLSDIPNPQ
ncbi:MAG: hypothetical protein HQ568_12170 [Calditrichaeota bacterium]|nr:hypothetical protein [Calditrichota bacterium]